MTDTPRLLTMTAEREKHLRSLAEFSRGLGAHSEQLLEAFEEIDAQVARVQALEQERERIRRLLKRVAINHRHSGWSGWREVDELLESLPPAGEREAT